MLSLFGKERLDDLCEGMKGEHLEGLDEHNISRFHTHLTNTLFELPGITKDELLRYDQNVVSHTLRIIKKREDFRWKYFQYMALLFTEVYLDKYFRNPYGLLEELSEYTKKVNAERDAGEKIENYTIDDLNKIAFWQATGSGKTLIMHVNILQYHHYLSKHARKQSLNKTVLLTPNEGLSAQHLEEFTLSGMKAGFFDKDSIGAFMGNEIEIIDIHKLKEESKEKTVSVDCFEGNNLVLVDEGHRGASGTEWLDKRNRLCEDGFSIEYSATFGQAVKGNKALEQLYAKCILFDYSYKYFYQDGYGKEYSILNLAEDKFDEQRQLYLIACLLSFYQQLRIFDENERVFVPFNLEEPLWIFVGSKVTAVRTENKVQVSDVIDILMFIKRFLQNKSDTIDFIDRLLNGNSQLNDIQGNDLFVGKFSYLEERNESSEDIFLDIKRRVFNCDMPESELHLENLKGAQGEIGLRLGDNDYFGVINVGDDSKLLKLCEEQKFNVVDRDFSDSLFDKINKEHSTVKLLIGSKKFSEGWNSWRVSTMGLMNVGKSEGSEIIQLFGRGIRLKGYEISLKRSSRLPGIPAPKHIEPVETLNVFGVRADYMKQFREYLEGEGVKNKDDFEEIILPVISNLGNRKLKYPQLQEGINFKKTGPKPSLGEPDEYMLEHPVIVDWYPKIEALQARGIKREATAILNTAKLEETHTAFMDIDAIYFELQKYKNERCYYNLNISKDIIPKLLKRNDWYELYIPEEDMEFHSFEQVSTWQDVAVTLLKKYCDHYYNAKRLDYEKDKIEYKYLDEVEAELAAQGKKGNIFDEYTILVEKSRDDIIKKLTDLKGKIENHEFDDFEYRSLRSFSFDRHLYKPLIHIRNSEIKVMPVALNKGENQFVVDLKNFFENNEEVFKDKELYLLRNLSRGRGIGFFQAHNFYPDFIMWLVHEGRQYITFIDPKGLKFCSRGLDDPKIRFFKEIKTLESQIGDGDVVLGSFIIFVTPYQYLGWWGNNFKKADLENNHILFQEEAVGYVKKLIYRTLRPAVKPIEVAKVKVSEESELFFSDVIPEGDDAGKWLPIYSLAAACGKIVEGMEVKEERWIYVDRVFDNQHFVVRAVGDSMIPNINDGDHCIFRANPVGPYTGLRRIYLFQYQGQPDPDTGGSYTIKGYRSYKGPDGFNVRVELLPFNKAYSPIEFKVEDGDIDQKLHFVAEFIDII